MNRFLLGSILTSLLAVMTSCGDTSAVEDIYSGKPIDRSRLKTNFLEFHRALKMYRVDVTELPNTEQGLWALSENPGIDGWKGPYLKTIKTDPWGNDYVYTLSNDGDSYTITSLGPDGVESEDDVHGP